MFDYQDKKHIYKDALDLKHPESQPIAKEHNLKQTAINMTFDTVEDAAGFTSAVLDGKKEKVYINEPNFLNPRKADDLFIDYSEKCVVM
ncbi:Transmembrane 9 superfamily member 2 [Mucor velutinosus]|uniref:Transmembrane 9 superfamily member 2 n=1 Tax=Mucor velutinosus TaxID=708070 RepID=A0AAN7HRQ1_9FUNG|nr:Transmembrane 9 superfamily member 2 [Mucor velutinosus]